LLRFLQFWAQDDSESLIVGATNLEELLDDALYQRFDNVIWYRLADEAELRELIVNRLAAFKIGKVACSEAARFAQGMSHAEVSRACDEAAKLAVLDDRRTIELDDLKRAIELRRGSRSLARS
jgi:AAA+ superfamily predicted ATPase